jgi:hypothetical protein
VYYGAGRSQYSAKQQSVKYIYTDPTYRAYLNVLHPVVFYYIVSRMRGDYCKTGIGLTTGFIGSQTVTHNYSVYTSQLTIAAATLL